MREILFRGKCKSTGEWVEGYFVTVDPVDMPNRIRKPKAVIFPIDAKCNWFNKYFYSAREVVPETVGQFTGLLDKNGKKIFEGDIFVYYYNNSRGKEKVDFYIVTYDDEYGIWQPFGDSGCGFDPKRVVIIDNIHDNPKLPEVK